MKKQLLFMNNESGFLLPYVLFISIIIFVVIASTIQMYQNEIWLTYQNIDQLKVETLFQMGYEKFIDENTHKDLDEKKIVQYTFPDGDVSIEFTKKDEDEGQLLFQIATHNNSYVSLTKPLNLTLLQ